MIIRADPLNLVEEDDGAVGSKAKVVFIDDDDWISAVDLDLVSTGNFKPFLHLSGLALAK